LSRRHFFSSCSISFFGTATTRFAKLESRSMGVRPGTVTFTGLMISAFCRVEAAAWISQHVSGSSLPVSAV
jgi:hypothetical protein